MYSLHGASSQLALGSVAVVLFPGLAVFVLPPGLHVVVVLSPGRLGLVPVEVVLPQVHLVLVVGAALCLCCPWGQRALDPPQVLEVPWAAYGSPHHSVGCGIIWLS